MDSYSHQKEVRARQRTWLGPGSPGIQVCCGAHCPTMSRASCEDISPLGKTKGMGLEAILIYFGEQAEW